MLQHKKSCIKVKELLSILGLSFQLFALAAHASLDNIMPLELVSHRAVGDGPWNSQATWGGEVPPNGARVHIPAGVRVEIHTELATRIETIRLEGTLSFDPSSDTRLLVETLGSWPGSALEIGTEENPVQPGSAAEIVIIDEAAIDTGEDFAQLGKGLILMGEVRMSGAAKTAWTTLAQTPSAGDQVLTLSSAPLGWTVGDAIVVAGTALGDPTSDERRLITSINGAEVTLDAPLELDHHAPRPEFDVHVANLSRNVILRSEHNGSEIARRGHVMFMHNQDVILQNARFFKLGRTDKRVQVDDWFFPTLEADVYEAGPRTNIRGRYSVHFHRGGVDSVATTPAVVRGCVVEDDPGWAYVNHSSNVLFEDNVSYSVVGGAFQSESGDEIGAFRRNLAIRTVNPDYPLRSFETTPVDLREDSQDFAFQGCGFWFHGGGLEVVDNVASGTTGHAFIYWTEGQREVDTEFDLQNMFKVSHIPNGDLLGDLENIQSWWIPLQLFRNNIGYSATKGFAAYYLHATIFEDITELTDAYLETAHSTIDALTLWNVEIYGVEMQNCERFTFKDLILVNGPSGIEDPIIGINNANHVARRSVWKNCRVEGFDIGMIPPMQGAVTIEGGLFANTIDFQFIPPQRDSRAPGWDRDLRIDGTRFAARPGREGEEKISFQMLGGETLSGALEPWAEPEFQSKFFLIPDRIVVDVDGLAGRLYYEEQAADYVPIDASNLGDATGDYAAAIKDKTNAELQAILGLSFAGALLPADAVTHPMVQGGMVSPTDQPMNIPAGHFIGLPLEPADTYDGFDFYSAWDTSAPVAAVTSPFDHALASTPPTAYTRVVSFGDSLSDMGNNGLASSGPTWVYSLSTLHLELPTSIPSLMGGFNYAYSGAVTGSANDASSPPSAASQVERFAADHGSFASPDLVTLWIGGNDFLGDPFNPVEASTLESRYEAILEGLVLLGAKTILWCLVPDYGLLPDTYGTSYQADATAYSSSVNQAIAAVRQGIEAAHSNVSVVLFDFPALQQDLLDNYTDYGLTINPTVATPDGADLSTRFLMPDGIHPTAKGHEIIAAAAFAALTAPVPPLTARNASGPTEVLLTHGHPEADQPLRVNPSPLLNTNETTIFSYQWQREGAPINGATKQSYTPTASDVGARISVVVSFTDLDGQAQSLTGTWEGVVQSPDTGHSFYVAPDGSDSNDGSLSAPWRTLDGARLNVRRYLDDSGHITVNFMSGHYPLTDTVVFSLPDSGTANQTVTYQALDGHSPVFSSLQAINNWTTDPNNPNISIAPLPKGIPHVRFLYDSRSDLMERSATPKFTTEEPAASPGQVENTWDILDRQDERTNFQYPESFTFPDPSFVSQYDLRQSIIGWHMEILPLATIDTVTRRVTTAVPACYEIRDDTTEENPAALWILNSYEGLNKPGEWACLDGSIYLHSRDPNSSVLVPTLSELVRVDDGTNGKDDPVTPVSYLRFNGLTFTGGDFYVMQDTRVNTLADRQREVTIQHDWAVVDKPTGLLRLRNTSHITVENCRFTKSGGTGLRIDRYGQNIRILGNEFSHLGRCGVSLIGRGPGYGNVNLNNSIVGNTFQRTGREKWAAPALVLDQTTANLVKHNAFLDTDFTAITVTGPRQMGILSKAEKLDAAADNPATAIDYLGREFHYYGMAPSLEAFLSSTEEYVLDPGLASLHAMQFVYNYDNYIEENLFLDVADGAELFFNGKAVYISGGTRDMDPAIVRKNYFRYNYIYDSKAQSYVDYAWYNDYDQDGAWMVGNMMQNLTAPGMPLVRATSGYAEGGLGRDPILIQANLDLNSSYGEWAVDGNDQGVAGIELRGNLQNGQGGSAAQVRDYEKMLAFLQRGAVATAVLPETSAPVQLLTAKIGEFSGNLPTSSTASAASIAIGLEPDQLDGSQLQIILQAGGDGRYRLQRSSDLKNWTTVQAIEIVHGSAKIRRKEIDASAFYRIQPLN